MKIILDTSALVKLYHFETGTDYHDNLFETNTITEIFLSDLAKVEFISAIWKKVRTKDLTDTEATSIITSFNNDYDNYSFINLDSDLVLVARDLIDKYGLKGLRTLDSLQLASIMNVKSELTIAITADEQLQNLIELEGVKTN